MLCADIVMVVSTALTQRKGPAGRFVAAAEEVRLRGVFALVGGGLPVALTDGLDVGDAQGDHEAQAVWYRSGRSGRPAATSILRCRETQPRSIYSNQTPSTDVPKDLRIHRRQVGCTRLMSNSRAPAVPGVMTAWSSTARMIA